MSAVNKKLSSAHKHLEGFEVWKFDHDTAMECYDLEDRLAEGVFVFDVIGRAHQMVRWAVYRGRPVPPDAVDRCRELYEGWLQVAQGNLPLLDKHAARFGSVKGAEDYRSRIAAARDVLATWSAPPVARAPGMHAWTVSDEEAAALQALVNAPAGAPGVLSRELKPMTEGDASLIR